MTSRSSPTSATGLARPEENLDRAPDVLDLRERQRWRRLLENKVGKMMKHVGRLTGRKHHVLTRDADGAGVLGLKRSRQRLLGG
jgi:hypothetical protein